MEYTEDFAFKCMKATAAYRTIQNSTHHEGTLCLWTCEGVSKIFRTQSITKYTLTFGIAR